MLAWKMDVKPKMMMMMMMTLLFQKDISHLNCLFIHKPSLPYVLSSYTYFSHSRVSRLVAHIEIEM